MFKKYIQKRKGEKIMTLQQKAVANYYLAKFKMMDFIERAKREELGASEMVVVIILIVIVILVANIFKKQLGNMIGEYDENSKGVMGKLYNFINKES